MIYCLRAMGELASAGKTGRATAYVRATAATQAGADPDSIQ
jgi:hypothetical protein